MPPKKNKNRFFRLFAFWAVSSAALLRDVVGNNDVFANYDSIKTNDQAFLLMTMKSLYEDPDQDAVPFYLLMWFSGFDFDVPGLPFGSSPPTLPDDETAEDNNDNATAIASGDDELFPGYVARGKIYVLGRTLDDLRSVGADFSGVESTDKDSHVMDEPLSTLVMAASYVPSQNILEGRIVMNNDDWILSFWDDGNYQMPFVTTEGHGHALDSVSNAYAQRGIAEWITIEKAAKVLNENTTEFLTPEKHAEIYETTWDRTHDATSGGGGARSQRLLSLANAFVGSLVMVLLSSSLKCETI